jgi:imidazolonepropionase-like amidohydrolase
MKLRALLLAALAFACTPATPPPAVTPATPAPAASGESVRRYDFIMGGTVAGGEQVTQRGSERSVHFEFNDRGRGPKTDSTIVLGDGSIVRSLVTKGNDYLKSPVDESFVNGAWSNGSEKGQSAGANAFYLSMYGAPEELGMLAKALLAAPGHRLALLPSGEASIRSLGDFTLKGTHITCYAIDGLGFTPGTLWLDDANDLFANVSSWSSLIREGYGKEAAQQLIDAEKIWTDAEVVARAKRLMHHALPGAILIRHASLFDPETKSVTPNTTILIRGNKIEAVGPDGSIQPRYDAEIIDAGGRTVLPGLWDMHTHHSETDGLLHIAAGVTNTRDLGNDVDFIVELKKKYDTNTSVGPRIVLAALVDGSGPFSGPTKLKLDSEEDARRIIDRVAPLGFEQTKIYSSIKPELVPYIARISHEHGMRVSGHIPAGMRAEEAVRAGYDEIQHANMLFLNFFPDVKDTRTPERFTAVARRGADLDLGSAEVKAFVELLRERKTVVDPTVSVFEDMFTARRGQVSPGYASIADRLPPQVRRGVLTGGLPVPEGMDQRYRDSFAKMLALVKLLHDSGVPIVAGTDALPGFALHRELELYVKAGIPAPDVLRIATLGAATVARRADRLGSVTPGKLADLIIVNGDPTTNISDIRKVVTVIKDGIIYQVQQIHHEIGVQ